MGGPTLTMIMPNYNHARFLPQAIEAVLAQSRPPDEFLICDDASRDDSVAIARGYAARHARLRVLANDRNRGALATCQRLLDEARGDFVYAGAADDMVLPGFFEAAMAMAASHPRTGIVFGAIETWDETRRLATLGLTRWAEPVWADPGRYLADVLQVERVLFSHSAGTVYRREAMLEGGGFRPGLGCFGDTFLLRAVALRHGAGYLARPVVRCRVLPDSVFNAAGRRPFLWLKIVLRVVRLMQTPPYSGVFPRSYVRYFTGMALAEVLGMPFIAAAKGLEHRLAGLPVARGLLPPAKRLAKAWLFGMLYPDRQDGVSDVPGA
ncbi:MAG: glycosyltransferase family 2 protein [Candidatus Riflebacteria bacterium]|nr:glycosyltransferase family 2 protein [Candidatus Riflebacteria bacterium]